MKKLISIMLAVFMLATAMSAFAAVTPMTEPGNATQMYFDKNTYTGSNAYYYGGVTGGTPSPTIAVADDAITITHKTEAKEYAYYFFGGGEPTDAWEDDNLSFGYDLTFSGLSGFTANTLVFSQTPGSHNPKPKTEGGSKTSWHFYDDTSPNIEYRATADGKIILGSATMEQDRPYTIKIYADCKADTFVVTVTDVATGTVQEAITTGKILPVFTDLGKMELGFFPAANVGASVTIDNAFVNYDDPYSVLDITTPANELKVADDGTVTFGARVSQDYENPAIYINDKFVESFPTVAGKRDYQVVATLPADTGFGDATIKLTATKDGKPVEVTKTVKLFKEVITTATAIPFSGTTPFGFQIAHGGTAVADAGANGGYDIEFPSTSTECTTYTFTTYRSGVYETSLEFKTATPASAYIQERLTYSTFRGTGLELSGTTQNVGSNDYHLITNKTGTVGTESIVANEWNKVSTRIDFTNGTWAYYLNGKLAQSGAINNFETKNSFTALRYMFAGVTVRNLKVNKVSGVPTVTGVTVVNADGSTLDATSAAASSAILDKITFTTSDAITLGAGGAKIVAADGTTVPATVTADGTTITADYTGSGVLPTGTYKLVIGSDATVGGTVLGASVVKEFALTSASTILTPVANAVVTDTTNLSIYGENADKVEFYINDALVTAFTEATADGIYTYAYTPATDGTKQFDAYVYSGTEVTVVSTTFEVTAISTTIPKNNKSEHFEEGFYAIYASPGGHSETYETGRAVIEGTITLHAQDDWYFNIGASANADWSVDSSTGWGALEDMIGYTTDSYRLFNADGTIYNTKKTYALNTPMKVKVVLDMNADRYEFYVDGELMGTKGPDTTKTRNIANIAYFYNRVRFTHKTTTSTATVADFTIYQEYAAPKVTGVAYGTTGATKLAGSYVVPETADTVTLTLDKAYIALDEADVTVKLGGATVTPTVAYDAEAATITLSGLELVKGKKLEVTIAETATIAIPYADKTNKQISTQNVQAGSKVEAVITVADSNCLAILPMKAATVGTNNFASYKYLNAGTGIDARLILANYATAGGIPSLNKAAVEAATLEAGSSGIIGASMTETFKAFLWNIETLEPLVDAAE